MKHIKDILAPRYAAHERLVAPMRAYCEVWRIVASLVLISATSLAGSRLLIDLAAALAPQIGALHIGETPAAMLVLLFSFLLASLGVVLAVRFLHHSPIDGVLGPMPDVVQQFGRTLLGLVVLGGVLLAVPPYTSDPPLEVNLPLSTWLTYLPLALVAVLVQVEAEELVFRGYLQQSLAARFGARWVWMGVPSALFALGHYLPQEAGENAWLIALWAGVFGILMADLTARAGTLGPAIAVHFANNVVALLIMGSPSSLNGLALYVLPYELSDPVALRPWLWADFAFMLVSWLVARLAIRA